MGDRYDDDPLFQTIHSLNEAQKAKDRGDKASENYHNGRADIFANRNRIRLRPFLVKKEEKKEE